MDKYSYKLHRTLTNIEKGFIDYYILDKNELALYVASDEFKAKEQGKLSCTDYTKENLVHYLNDHSKDQIITPDVYRKEQEGKHWDKNWLDQLFGKDFEEDIESYKSDYTERFAETVISYMERKIKNQFWIEYLPAYKTDITNTIQDYEKMLKDPATCLGESAYFDVVSDLLENSVKNDKKNDSSVPFYQLFRESFISIMNEKFGIDEKLTEISLEKNSQLWRPCVMFETYQKTVAQKGLPYSVPDKYKETLLKMFEYEYYQDNKKIIDELGVATDNMKLNAKQVGRLNAMIEKIEKKIVKKQEKFYQTHSKQSHTENMEISFNKKKRNIILAKGLKEEINNQKNNDDGRTM